MFFTFKRFLAFCFVFFFKFYIQRFLHIYGSERLPITAAASVQPASDAVVYGSAQTSAPGGTQSGPWTDAAGRDCRARPVQSGSENVVVVDRFRRVINRLCAAAPPPPPPPRRQILSYTRRTGGRAAGRPVPASATLAPPPSSAAKRPRRRAAVPERSVVRHDPSIHITQYGRRLRFA